MWTFFPKAHARLAEKRKESESVRHITYICCISIKGHNYYNRKITGYFLISTMAILKKNFFGGEAQ